MNRELLKTLYGRSIEDCLEGEAWEWEESFAEEVVKECVKALIPVGMTVGQLEVLCDHFGITYK